ncbi:hypothetical protein LXL04_010774 [Taraxacum kok-saghyz]
MSNFFDISLRLLLSFTLMYLKVLSLEGNDTFSTQLGKNNWNFSLNPCDKDTSWQTPYNKQLTPEYNNSVECNCSYPGGVCHVVSLYLKGQNLDGSLPVSLANLTYIKTVSVRVNLLSGRIPKYLGKMTSLEYLSLESNKFFGVVPAELGKLKNLENLTLGTNNLSGELPKELNNLTNLVELRLSGNNFTGKIPSLKSWTKLRNLDIQASGFKGPIPASISTLSNLQELLISDLSGKGSQFPNLSSMKGMKKLDLSFNNLHGDIPDLSELYSKLEKLPYKYKQLYLRSVTVNLLSGRIPKYLGKMTSLEYLSLESNKFFGVVPAELGKLKNLENLTLSTNNLSGELPKELNNLTNLVELRLSGNNFTGKIPSLKSWTKLRNLDLSFNNLHGDIPDLSELYSKLEKLYLTGNSLNGNFPKWISNKNNQLHVDLSYNNLNKDSLPNSSCSDESLSYSSTRNDGELAMCLSSRPCSKDYYSVNINCGGPAVTTRNKVYFEADERSGGPTYFLPSTDDSNWGFSSTGSPVNVKETSTNYITTNVSILTMDDSQLYTNARLAPVSLTYYGRCLANGNYTVTLHFAEIIFRDNRSYQSLGKRAFDIYVQGINQRKDYDIQHEAGGVNKKVNITLKKIPVTNKTLEIRFQYAGKGTTAVPKRGMFGPLVSAISMKSEFEPPPPSKKPMFIAIGASVVALCVILTAIGIAWKKGYIWDKISREKELRGLDLQTGVFTYRQIMAATDKFDESNKLGEGGFGSVYKGTLLDGTPIAVKQLSSKSKQGNREFVNEIGMIAGIQHHNVVRLHGCCVERNHLLLVYEYMENNSLAHALFDRQNSMSGIIIFINMVSLSFQFIEKNFCFENSEQGVLEIDWPTRQRICIGIAKGLTFLHDESVLKMVHRDIKATNILLDADLTPKISDFGLAKLDEEENTHITTRIAGTI